MHKSILFSALLMMLAGCQADPAEKKEKDEKKLVLSEELPGTWEAVSVKVLVNTAENTDSSYLFEISEERWLGQLGVRPVKTYYQLDNKYRQEFVAINDSLLSLTRGMYNTFGDTLMMIEPNATYQYTVSLGQGLAEFRALLDWDGDGQEDDEYLGIHRRISRTAD